MVTDKIERYEVKAKNHKFIFDCNRPEMVDTTREHISWVWTLVDGDDISKYWQKEITTELQSAIGRIYWQARNTNI